MATEVVNNIIDDSNLDIDSDKFESHDSINVRSLESVDNSKKLELEDDIENGQINKLVSRSFSVTPDQDFEFVDGINLINDCPFCYKPFGKFAANIKGTQISLYIYLVSMIPLIVRFTIHTTYIHFTESEPTFKKSFETRYLFIIGAISSSSFLAGEIFEGIKALTENIRDDHATSSANYEYNEVDLHKGCAVLYRSPNGVPTWITKNNKLAQERPTSFYKWSVKSTFKEKMIHIYFSSRWIFGSSILISTTLSVGVLGLVSARSVNGSGLYLYLIHIMNGFVIPMFIVFGIKLTYIFIKTFFKNLRFEHTGKLEEPVKYTRTGKIKSNKPLYIFLTDKCPCNYAVDVGSKLPTQYKYSIRYHCMLTGALKYACLTLITLYGLFIVGVSLYSALTRPELRTILRR